jgi:hypothetical protein
MAKSDEKTSAHKIEITESLIAAGVAASRMRHGFDAVSGFRWCGRCPITPHNHRNHELAK